MNAWIPFSATSEAVPGVPGMAGNGEVAVELAELERELSGVSGMAANGELALELLELEEAVELALIGVPVGI